MKKVLVILIVSFLFMGCAANYRNFGYKDISNSNVMVQKCSEWNKICGITHKNLVDSPVKISLMWHTN